MKSPTGLTASGALRQEQGASRSVAQCHPFLSPPHSYARRRSPAAFDFRITPPVRRAAEPRIRRNYAHSMTTGGLLRVTKSLACRKDGRPSETRRMSGQTLARQTRAADRPRSRIATGEPMSWAQSHCSHFGATIDVNGHPQTRRLQRVCRARQGALLHPLRRRRVSPGRVRRCAQAHVQGAAAQGRQEQEGAATWTERHGWLSGAKGSEQLTLPAL